MRFFHAMLNTGGGFDFDYRVILNYATAQGYTLPSLPQRVKQNQLMVNLKANSLWTGKDVFYVFANDGSKEFGTLNWKSPAVNQCTIINSMTWTPNIGFESNGTNSYLNTTYRPTSNAVNFTQNDNGVYYWIINNVAGSSTATDWGASNAGGANGIFASIRTNTDAYVYRSNQNTNQSNANTTSSGFYHQKRTASNATALFKNGSSVGTGTIASATRTDRAIYVGAVNIADVAAGFSNGKQFATFGVGASLNGSESTLNNIINTYITSL